jgi:hypothetical protein
MLNDDILNHIFEILVKQMIKEQKYQDITLAKRHDYCTLIRNKLIKRRIKVPNIWYLRKKNETDNMNLRWENDIFICWKTISFWKVEILTPEEGIKYFDKEIRFFRLPIS